MDNTNYTTEHRKGQHLLNEERHEIEVRLKDGWSTYRIAKHLGRPYNTIKNEIKRGSVSLYNGKIQRYKADEGKKVYLDHRQNCRKQYRLGAIVHFLQYVIEHFQGEDKWNQRMPQPYVATVYPKRQEYLSMLRDSSSRVPCGLPSVSDSLRSSRPPSHCRA